MKDLKRQAEDIDLIIERMDEQVKELTRAYREELGEIEVSLPLLGSLCQIQSCCLPNVPFVRRWGVMGLDAPSTDAGIPRWGISLVPFYF